MSSAPRFGLSAALVTPVRQDGSIDVAKFADHARACLAAGCGSITAFGTTGEGASIGVAERVGVLSALREAGIAPRRQIVGGIAAASLEEAEAQCRQLLDADCRALLLAPPFYFKGVSEEGIVAWFSALLHRLGGAARDVILYNIPSVTAVPLSSALIARVRAAFPGVVTGIKDSSGDWAGTQTLLTEHGDVAVLIGDERHLAQGVRLGGQGAISGLANVYPERLRAMTEGRDDAGIVGVVEEVLKFPVTPAVKSLVADHSGDASWRHARAPLVALTDAEAARLREAVAARPVAA